MDVRRWFPLIAIFLLASCAGQKSGLSAPLHSEFKSIRVLSSFQPLPAVRRRNLVINSPNAINIGILAGLPAGLASAAIFGAIDIVKRKNAKGVVDTHLEKFETALADFDFQQQIDNEFGIGIRSSQSIPAIYEQASNEITKDHLRNTLNNMEEDALLVLVNAYTMTPQLESLEVFTQFMLYRRPESVKNIQSISLNPMYAVLLKTQSDTPIRRVQLPDADEISKRKREIIDYHNKKLETVHDFGTKKFWRDRKARLSNQLELEESTIVAEDYTPVQGESFWLANNAAPLLAALQQGIKEQAHLLKLALTTPAEKFEDQDTQIGIPRVLRVRPYIPHRTQTTSPHD